MGHYTSLRLKVRIKPEFTILYQSLISNAKKDETWQHVAKEINLPFVKEWINVSRHQFIPFGGVTISRWDGVDKWELSFVDGILTFQCSVKNYDNTVEAFFRLFGHTWSEIMDGEMDNDGEEVPLPTLPTPSNKHPMKLLRKSTITPLREALKLPSTYSIHTQVRGYRGIPEESVHYDLRLMTSTVRGHNTVWAVSRQFGQWEEISGEEWTRLAKLIILPHE